MTTTPHDVMTYPFNTADNLDLDHRYAQLRDTATMPRVRLPYGEDAWLATRYDDVRTVLGDKRFSRAEATRRDEPRLRAGRVTSGILAMDPPDHTRLRVLVSKAFTPRRVDALRPVVAELADTLAQDLRESGAPADLVDRFALPLPVQVICELLGVPVEDRTRFRVWSDNALSTTTLSAEEFDTNRDEMRDYMRELVAAKRAEPADDLMTALIAARDDDDRLTELEMVDLCIGILVAGHETTATQIPNFVLTLIGHDDADRSGGDRSGWERIRTDPSTIADTVEELMRIVPLGVGGGFARYALEDVQLGDTLVAAGDAVVVSIAAANRDPARFDDPELFDTTRHQGTRAGSGHMGFGHGAHHCLGAALARMELQEALRSLTRIIPTLSVHDVEWKRQMIVRGPSRLEIEW